MELQRLRWIILSIFCVYLLRPTFSAVSFTPKTAVLFPNGRVTFTCNETGFRSWIINETVNLITDDELLNINGVSSNNGAMLFITQSLNNTLYGCAIAQFQGGFITDTGILYVATAPDQVPDVMVITDSITLDDDDNINLTLSWGEPFNNFDPILDYTVSCSGDVTCPPNFTTTDNSTRNYTVANLTAITNYTFSVVATNSIGNGGAGVLNITAPSLSSSVIDVQVVVTPEDATNSTYLFTFTCIIHAESMADMCEVTVTPDDPTTSSETGTGSVENSMATLTIGGLACGVTYSITAAGRLNGELFGLISSFGTEMGNCSSGTTPSAELPTNATTPVITPPITETPGGTTTDDDDSNTGAIVGGVIGGICGAILIIILIILIVCCCMKREKSSRPRNAPVAVSNVPVYDTIEDPVVSNQVKMEAYQGLPSDRVKMETNPAYKGLTFDQVKVEPNPAHQLVASNQANKGPDPAYQYLSSYTGRASASKQKPAGNVNNYVEIINEQNITITKNSSSSVP